MQTNLKFLFLISLIAFTTACTQEEEVQTSEEITEEDAVEVVENALVAETKGVAGEVEEVDQAIETYAVESNCGLTGDSAFVYPIDRPNVQGEYNASYQWELVCDGAIPSTFIFDFENSGYYETNRIKSDDQGFGNWIVTELLTGSNYLFNGMYTREGQQKTKFQESKTFNSTVDMMLKDLAVEKTTGQIQGGTASFTFSGTSSTGVDVTYTGSIEFLGNQSAIITINGNSYTVNW